ncbi:hypothetical protein B7494_g2753 [Chlorociboria aeruginascens]|nr:hypothetical protein B7494_g2753 [Chlorociboria aeruginascens]
MILNRTEKQWKPQIGEQEYSPTVANGHHENIDENQTLLNVVAARLDRQGIGTTVTTLRDNMQFVLRDIYRICDPPALVAGPPGKKPRNLGWKMALLLLVNVALAVPTYDPTRLQNLF